MSFKIRNSMLDPGLNFSVTIVIIKKKKCGKIKANS